MPASLDDLVRRGAIASGAAHMPPAHHTTAEPKDDEVVVFRNLFAAGLRFPLDPVVLGTF